MRILLLYHFFHPDTVVSAELFSELAEDLAAKGHQVTVFTSNRLIRSEQILSSQEQWQGVEIRRFSRPGLKQGSNVGRMLNSLVLQGKWLWAFLHRRKEFDAVVLGTDPQFAYWILPAMRMLRRRVKLVHWCFDLYPEAILVNSAKWMKVLAWLVKPLSRLAYRCLDEMVDIGGCMRKRLLQYHHHARCTTLTPWALAEAPAVAENADGALRRKLFGDAKIGILYSGTVGHAHDIRPFIQLARQCREQGLSVGFCFAGYGNCYSEQTAEITAADTNITLAGFASEAELAQRLSAADFHLISLRPGWEGIVVPSKFFGALAMGRPVIFSGPAESEIAGWIREFGLGYCLDGDTWEKIRDATRHPEEMETLRQRAWQVYQEEFSRKIIVSQFERILQDSH